jgi:hypothetical protein
VTRAALLAAPFLILAAGPALAQRAIARGHVSFLVDALPDPDASPGRQTVTEGRMRLFAERRDEFGSHLRLVLSGHVDALVARTGVGETTVRDATARPLDLYAELTWARAELRAGSSRVVWGRLDEFQPTDVVNPIDLSKFLLEGRSEARLAVGLVRGRFFLPASTTLEVLAVPGFRAARFDQLDEPSSPFNLGVAPNLVERREPPFGTGSLQGGARVTSTAGRVDWGASFYRGLRAFPTVTVRPSQPLLETFPRYTMVGADFETVRGAWGVRGEAAFFERQSIEAGVGVDRRAGSYRMAGNLLYARRPAAGSGSRESDVTLVAAADRSFARETRTLRLFAVHSATDGTTFVRAIGAVSLRDDVWLEASGGLFTGTSTTAIGQLSRRDFLYAKLKVYF